MSRKLLYIESSPRKSRSHSISASRAFLEVWREKHGTDSVDLWDVWHAMLPVFDGDVLNAKYSAMAGQKQSSPEAAAWETITAMADRLKRADALLLSAPMWNFSIPYRLKHLIDLITQPGITFGYDPAKGYYGLVTGKPAVVVVARGGAYPAGSAMDMQKGYLDLWLKFIGFTEIQYIEIEPTIGNPDSVQAVRNAALDKAKAIAGKM